MRIVIPGGSGHVGTLLARALHEEGHEVVVLSRRPESRPWRVESWDGRTVGPWQSAVDGCDAVINLAGRTVDCRMTAANRRQVLGSRVDSTRAVGAAIAGCRVPPPVWLQAGTATIYAHRHDAANDEHTGILGADSSTPDPPHPDTWQFSVDVAKAWERTLDAARTPDTRKVSMRISLVMAAEPGGVFEVLAKLTRWWLGGRIGDGRQFVSWIHEADLVAAVRWLIERDELRGPVNLSTPNPLPQADFMAALRRAAGVRIGLPAPRWLLEIGTFLLRTESELVLKSRRVVPARLLESGFTFRFPSWPEAAAELIGRYTRR